MITVNIDESESIEKAVWKARKAWITSNMSHNETYKQVADRLGVSSRTILRWCNEQGGTRYHLAQKISHDQKICYFCNSTENLVQHHVLGKKYSKTIFTCEECHKKFHALNKSYKK